MATLPKRAPPFPGYRFRLHAHAFNFFFGLHLYACPTPATHKSPLASWDRTCDAYEGLSLAGGAPSLPGHNWCYTHTHHQSEVRSSQDTERQREEWTLQREHRQWTEAHSDVTSVVFASSQGRLTVFIHIISSVYAGQITFIPASCIQCAFSLYFLSPRFVKSIRWKTSRHGHLSPTEFTRCPRGPFPLSDEANVTLFTPPTNVEPGTSVTFPQALMARKNFRTCKCATPTASEAIPAKAYRGSGGNVGR